MALGVAGAALGAAVLANALSGLANGHAGSTSDVARGAGANGASAVSSDISREAEAGGKSVNITLDDGPDPTWTPKALALLKQYDVKAVFCMIGPNAAHHPDLVKQVVAAGHRLCDHTVSHDTAMDKKPAAYQKKEIGDARAQIMKASGGVQPMYYRAPGGAFTPESREYAAAHGMRPLGWRIDPGDYEQPPADQIVQTVKAGVEAGHQTILMHDGGGNREQTLEALKQLLPWLKEHGYAFSLPKA